MRRLEFCVSVLLCLVSAVALYAHELDTSLVQAVKAVQGYRWGDVPNPVQDLDRILETLSEDAACRNLVATILARGLSGEGTLEGRDILCRRLSRWATEEQVPLLALLLLDEDLGHMALYVLLPMQTPLVDLALLDALSHAQGKTRIGILHALGSRRVRQAIPCLKRFLSNDDPMIVEAAARALGSMADRRSVRALRKASEKVHPKIRGVVLDALLDGAEAWAVEGRKSRSLKYFRWIYENEEGLLKASALRGLLLYQSEDPADLLVDSLTSEDPFVVAMALELMRDLPSENLIVKLDPVLPNLDPSIQTLVVTALKERGDERALPLIQQAMDVRQERVSVAVFRAVGLLGSEEEISWLLNRAAMALGNKETTEAVSWALSRLRGQGVDEELIGALKDKEPARQTLLVNALSQRGATCSLPALMTLAWKAQDTLSREVFRAIRNLGSEKDLDAVLDLLLRGDVSIRQEAERTALTLALKASDRQEVVGWVRDRMERIEEEGLIVSLTSILGGLPCEQSLDILMDLAQRDSRSHVQLAVTRSLGAWPDDAPLETLRAWVKHGEDDAQRVLALRGFIRMVGSNEARSVNEALQLYRWAFEVAPSLQEKRMVLSNVGRLGTLEAMEWVISFLDQEDLKKESEAALLRICQNCMGVHFGPTKRTLERLRDESEDQEVRIQAEQNLKTMAEFGDFITPWEVSPAYVREGAHCYELFDIPFPPEENPDLVPWRPLSAGSDPSRPWVVDILSVLPGEHRVAYVRTRIWSEKERDLVLELGTDDGVKVWLEQEMIHQNNTARPLAKAQEVLAVTLKPGWNDLLLKVTQNIMGWEICAVFKEKDGSPAQGLQYGIGR